MFYEGSLELFSGSTLVQQSLSNIKANKILSILFYGPGELNEKFSKCKYISFDQFYDSITKIDNYMYITIPTFINLKNCLMTKRKEMEFKMNNKCQKDFLKISYEILNRNRNQNSARTLLKKCFDPKQIKKKKIIDPLKDIEAIKQKKNELKLKRIIQIKKSSKSLSYNFIEKKNKINNENENKNKIISKSDNKINNNKNIITYSDRKKSNFNSLLKFVSIDEFNANKNKNMCYNLNNKINNDDNNNNTSYNNIYSTRKENSISTQNTNDKNLEKEGIKQEKFSSILKKKIIKNPRKGILKSPSETTFISQQSFILNKSNSNTTVNKKVSFSDELELKNSQSQHNINNEITQFNMSNKKLLNYDKIKSEQIKVNLKNSLINFSKINTDSYTILKSYFAKKTSEFNHSQNNSFLSRRSTFRKSEILNKKNMEKGDYYKFSSMIFPPCIIKNKDNSDSLNSSFRKKGRFSLKLRKHYFNMSKPSKMNKSDCLFKSLEELKNEINGELKKEKNSYLLAVNEILKLDKYADEEKESFHLADLSINQAEPKNFVINSYHIKNKK